MKTIVHIVLSDEERNHLACEWDGKESKRMVSRGEVSEFVFNAVKEELRKAQTLTKVTTLDTAPEEIKKELSVPGPIIPVEKFKPSRGDEEYLYKPKSVELKDACSKMLDLAEDVERLTWEVLEDNRATT